MEEIIMGKYDFELDLYDENTISWIAQSVEAGSDVLEFGPANGRLTRYLKEKKGCHVDIVEIDEESGSEAAQYAEVSYIGDEEGDIEKYYWLSDNKKYDFIIFADVLEHLIHSDEVLKRCRRVIKENGKILVSIPNAAHNSVIIELFNDEFSYNPTGILDNTHVHFFTRSSFEKMAAASGWAVIGEKAKEIRVGETEIQNTYKQVPREVYKELLHRPHGNVYQYMFTLVPSERYLSGDIVRTVNLDSTSYYYTEIFFGDPDGYDYKKSASKYLDPHNGKVDMTVACKKEEGLARIKLINCNAIVENVSVDILQEDRSNYEGIEIKEYNGEKMGDRYYFLNDIPELRVDLPQNTIWLRVKADIVQYDFDDTVIRDILAIAKHEQQHAYKVRDDYEKEIDHMKKNIEDIREESKKSAQIYEREITKKDEERRNCIETYEQEIAKKDEERRTCIETYEKEIARREEERNKLIEELHEK